ncbi:MAG: ATP-binding cassette domain-containing protein, partial [Bacteroidota bacterium]
EYGQIQIDKRALKAYDREGLRAAIGYAPQDVFLFSDSIHNNIAFGLPDASREAVEQAAKDASIYHSIISFPQGFDTIVGERGTTLSGGQKQRTAVARAWIRKPKILILDDVLSAVDTNTEETILQNLRNYRQQNPETAVIMVAHRITCVQDADLILVLEEGRVTERGNHEALIENGGYYARIYEKQLLEEVG